MGNTPKDQQRIWLSANGSRRPEYRAKGLAHFHHYSTVAVIVKKIDQFFWIQSVAAEKSGNLSGYEMGALKIPSSPNNALQPTPPPGAGCGLSELASGNNFPIDAAAWRLSATLGGQTTMHKAHQDDSMKTSHQTKKWTHSAIHLATVIILVSVGTVSLGVCLLSSRGPDPDSAMNNIIQAAIKNDERYVIDYEINRGMVPSIAISQPAWDILISYSSELPSATLAIATTGNHMDLVSSEIQIDCSTATIQCKSDNGQVVSPRYFYVHTCTVPTKSRYMTLYSSWRPPNTR